MPLTRPVYTPPTDPVEEQRREHFFRETVPVYPDTEFLHHCVHKAGSCECISNFSVIFYKFTSSEKDEN